MRSFLLTARNALRLDARARTHALRALAWMALARVSLAVARYARVRRMIERVRPRFRSSPMTLAECTLAIDRASRVLVGTRCLARGVAAACLLRREGRPATLTLGVKFDERQSFQAHAWVESDGVIVTGGDAARYASLGFRRVP